MKLHFALFGLAVAGVMAAGPALAEKKVFKLINQSGYALVRFYASPSNTDQWGPDAFGKDVLATGYSSNVTVPGNSKQCVYDFRMVFSDDDILYDTVDLCETGTYTIN